MSLEIVEIIECPAAFVTGIQVVFLFRHLLKISKLYAYEYTILQCFFRGV